MCLKEHEKEDLLKFLETEMEDASLRMYKASAEMAGVNEAEEEDREQEMARLNTEHARARVYYESLEKTHEAVILGEFNGDCQECGLEIPFDRFRACPAARRCVGCKTAEEVGKKRKEQLRPGTQRTLQAIAG